MAICHLSLFAEDPPEFDVCGGLLLNYQEDGFTIYVLEDIDDHSNSFINEYFDCILESEYIDGREEERYYNVYTLKN